MHSDLENRGKCVSCGRELIWSDFSYKQELCWDCFKKEAQNIIEFINEFRYTTSDAKRYINIVKYMFIITAERFGKNWKDI